MTASDLPYIGREFGRFRVLSLLGRGGLATVWRARDPQLGRDVALKILDATLALSPKAQRRFVHESQSVARLQHPGIVDIFDAGETEGLAWMALTLVDGETVTELAQQRLMQVNEALRIAIAAGEALAHAHARGVIHRDVTGRNIMVARDSRVFVLDFGLALVPELSRLTSTEAMMGTMAYMAPEAIRGSLLDARADVYGLGVVLFEALTGTYPFVADKHEAIAYRKLNSEPRSARELRPALSEEVQATLQQALAGDLERRFPNMMAMVEALRGALEGASFTAQPRPDRLPHSRVQPARDEMRPTRPDPLYVAVLPFTCNDADAGARELAQRLADTIAAALGNEDGVRFVPRATAEMRAETVQDLHLLGEEIGASVLIYGNVALRDSLVRVTLTALDASRGIQIGSDVIDGLVFQPFAIEDAVIAAARTALGLGRSHAPSRATPADPAEQDRFLVALRHLERFDREPLLRAAIDSLESLIVTSPHEGRLHATLGRAQLLMLDSSGERSWVSRAASRIDEAARISADLPETVLAVAELRIATGRAEEGRAMLVTLLERAPANVDAWIALARAQHVLRDGAGAIRSCRRAIALRPDDWRAWHMLGQIQFFHGEHEEAVEAWRQVIRITPDNARARRNLGSVYFHMDRWDDALQELEASLDEMPTPAAYSNYGTVLFYCGRLSDAVAAFDRAVALNPNRASHWGNLGNACRLAPGFEFRARPSLDRAIALMRDSLDRNPEDAEGRARLAGWYGNVGEYERAEGEMARAIALAPNNVLVLNSAAHLALQIGRTEEALRLFREAIDRGEPLMLLERDPELASLRDSSEFQRILAEGRAMRRAATAARHGQEESRQ